MKRKLVAAGAAASAWLAIACFAPPAAAAYPCQTVKLVEPYPPGGATGVVARAVADELARDIGRTVVVENRPGASGNIGSAQVARARPDGCTIMIGTDATHASNAHLFADFPYHPIDDFTPITMAARNVVVLVAHPSLPADTLGELIELAKRKPGTLFYGTPGIGSPHHLAGVLFNRLAGTDIGHVPYSGNAPAMSDVLGGQTLLMYSSLAPALQHIRRGTLKALGVTEAKRYAGLPDVPAIGEAVAGFEMTSWLGFFAPAGLPPDLLSTLHASITKTLRSPKLSARLENLGLAVVADAPEHFAAQQKADFERRGELIRANHIRAQ